MVLENTVQNMTKYLKGNIDSLDLQVLYYMYNYDHASNKNLVRFIDFWLELY